MKTKIQSLLTACCILSATAQAEWNAPRVISNGSAAGKPVLVFYANESTAGTTSQQAIRSLSSDAGQAEIAERIQEDLVAFQASTDRYVRQIQRAAEVTDLEAVIFTNRLARRGRYLLHRAEAADDQLQRQSQRYRPAAHQAARSAGAARRGVELSARH